MARRVIIRYNPILKERARRLRNGATGAERALWRHLKGRRMRGYDFHRQKPLGNYIVDFYCCELFLAIEVDGGYHDRQIDKDMIRQEAIERLGVSFLRFRNEEVFESIGTVLARIAAWIDRHADDRCADIGRDPVSSPPLP